MKEWANRAWAFVRAHSLSFRAAVGVLVLGASVLALVLSQRQPPVRASAIGARLELAAGEVTFKEGDRWTALISGVPLPVGAELGTGKGARALVRLSDGSSIFLRGDSRVALGADGVTLQQGEIWLEAPPSDRGALVHRAGDVSVSAADAGLSLRMGEGETVVVVTRGLAIVSSPAGRVEANAGEQAAVRAGAAPKVTPLAFWEDWTGGMGDSGQGTGAASGAGRIYGVDPAAPPGSPARTLEISRQAVRAVLRDGLAETEVDQTFSNPGGRQVEGWYWFTVPARAIVTSFSVETDGTLVEGEVIEKKEAAAQYGRAVRSGHEPALLEWVNGKSYRARIFPVPASGSRRVVLRYMELLSAQGGKLVYVYPMRSADSAQIGEFSLEVDLGAPGKQMKLATLSDAVVEDGGRRVTMRRSGYRPRADFQLEASGRQTEAPLRVSRFSGGGDRADYIMARFVPDIDWLSVKEPPGDIAIVVDTSASGDNAMRQQKAAAAEAILRGLSSRDHFTLIALDAEPTILYPKEGLAEASEKEIAAALERLALHAAGGATDLGAVFDVALGRLHAAEQPAVVYVGDGLPTSGEVSGEKLVERLRRSLSASRARFFTLAVGMEANHALLGELSRGGSGQSFRIDQAEMATSEVLRLVSAIKTPTMTDLAIDLGAGLDEMMLTASGKISRGEEMIVLARTHHALPPAAKVKGRLGGKDFEREYKVEIERGIGSSLVPRLWAAEKLRRLLGEAADPEDVRGKVVDVGLEYGLMTPFTSILALESERAYQDQGIKRRRSPLRGVRLTSLDPRLERDILDSMAPPPQVAFGCAQKEASPVASDEQAERKEASEPAAMPVARAVAQPSPPSVAAELPSNGEEISTATTVDGRNRADEASAKAGPMAGGAAPAGGLGARAGGKSAPGDPLSGDLPAAEPPPLALKPASPSPPSAPAKQRPALNALEKPGEVDKKAAQGPHDKLKNERPAPKPAMPPVTQCSDTARRPLADRIVVWSKRLRSAANIQTAISLYDGARASCEVPDWRAQSALLNLVQAKARNAGAAERLLSHFNGEPDTRKFIAQAILRRTVDLQTAAAVRRILFGEKIVWAQVDAQLAELDSPEARLSRLREILLGTPGDPEGELRIVRLLAQANQREEALAHGRRLREQGLMSPALALSLGDIWAKEGFQDEAMRTYSEIVEFDPASPDSRRLLGDVLLRHGFYGPAYRQYKTLSEIAPGDAVGWLRLAAAAAGSGRVDEALRIQRQVAAAEGTPGPDDPRQWARLWSAARLGRLLAEAALPPKDGKAPEASYLESLARKLKELQLVSGPGALLILTWEDLEAALSLVGTENDRDAPLEELSDASAVGLTAMLLPPSEATRLRFRVRWRRDSPGRDVRFRLHTILWDGKSFDVKVRAESLPAAQKEFVL